MPPKELLIMAVTRMKAGVCTAGFIDEPHPHSHLRWVRPVKSSDSLLLTDLCDSAGRVIEMGDVVTVELLRPDPEPVHCEDWLTNFVHQPVRLIRQLTDQKRADFLAAHIDKKPAEILQSPMRSLCLLQPQAIWADFTCDPYSGEYQARLGFQLDRQQYPIHHPQRGMAATDLKWRALGRHWLAKRSCTRLHLDHSALHQALAADVIYLSVGLSRTFAGNQWPLVIGVHPVPDYTITIDYTNL
jgi:hypothetical protein